MDTFCWRIVDAGLASWTELDSWSMLDLLHASHFLDTKQLLEKKAYDEAQRKR